MFHPIIATDRRPDIVAIRELGRWFCDTNESGGQVAFMSELGDALESLFRPDEQVFDDAEYRSIDARP
jgi:hypothetical protein